MKKFLLSLALVLLSGAAVAQSTIDFTFERNGENATVNVEGADGITATIEAVSPSPQGNATKTGVWNTGGAMGTDTNILCTSTNTSAAITSPIIYTLTISGVDNSLRFNAITFTHITANSSGEYQPQTDGDIRHCNFVLAVNDSELGREENFDIWVQGAWGNAGKDVTFEDIEFKASEGTVKIELSITKGVNNNGCFYGLKKISLTAELAEPAEPIVQKDFYHPRSGKNLKADELMAKTQPTYIAIKGLANKNHEYWNYVSGDANTSTEYFKQNAIFVWEPVNEGVAGSYYLRKINNGYMQASNPGEYAETTEGAAVFTAVKPVEVQSGANEEDEFNRDANSDGFIQNAGGYDYIVRFLTNGKWLNIGDRLTSAQAPAFNNGYGTFTVYQICELDGFDDKFNITIKNSGEEDYATFYSNAPTQMPDGVTAYAIAEGTINNDYISLNELAGGSVIPANTGVILKTAVEADENITVTVLGDDLAFATVVGDGEEPKTTNLLKGSVDKQYITEEAYVLGNKEGIGLYKAQRTNGSWLNNAGKAYLPVSSVATSARLLRFNFGGNATAIESVKSELDPNAPIYDLSGRRVKVATKGIYIQNGKKFMVK